MQRIPIPLVLAALVITAAVVVYLNISVNPLQITADGNATVALASGGYIWKTSGGKVEITSNASLVIYAYDPPLLAIYAPNGTSSLVYLNNTQVMLGNNKFHVLILGGRLYLTWLNGPLVYNPRIPQYNYIGFVLTPNGNMYVPLFKSATTVDSYDTAYRDYIFRTTGKYPSVPSGLVLGSNYQLNMTFIDLGTYSYDTVALSMAGRIRGNYTTSFQETAYKTESYTVQVQAGTTTVNVPIVIEWYRVYGIFPSGNAKVTITVKP